MILQTNQRCQLVISYYKTSVHVYEYINCCHLISAKCPLGAGILFQDEENDFEPYRATESSFPRPHLVHRRTRLHQRRFPRDAFLLRFFFPIHKSLQTNTVKMIRIFAHIWRFNSRNRTRNAPCGRSGRRGERGRCGSRRQRRRGGGGRCPRRRYRRH